MYSKEHERRKEVVKEKTRKDRGGYRFGPGGRRTSLGPKSIHRLKRFMRIMRDSAVFSVLSGTF